MNEKLFIPGKSKIGKWPMKAAVISYRLGMFSADEVMRKYDITFKELRKLNRKYYLELLDKNTEDMPEKSKKNDKERIAELESQLKEMKKRLDDSELEAAVWSKMVDIAEKEFGVDIKVAPAKNAGIARRSRSSGKSR